MNIVYGFGGLRSDREMLKLSPTILSTWKSYSFKIYYQGSTLKFKVTQDYVEIDVSGKPVTLEIYHHIYTISHHEIIERV